MIKQRDSWANPYSLHTRQDGIQAGRRTWRDLQQPPESLDVSAGLVNALILGLAVWGLIAVAALLMWEALL